jgi:hypothetical protein
MATGSNKRRLENQERAKARQDAAPDTNTSVREGATTTGRAGAQQISEARGETSVDPSVNLVIPPPKAVAGSKTSGVLRYPTDPEITSDTDYVVFSFFKYAPPFGGGRDTPNQAREGSTTTQSSGGYANYQNSNDRSYANPAADPIILYMPEDIQSQFGAGWNGAGFGAVAAGMMGLAGSVNTQKDFGALVQAGGSSISGGLKSSVFQTLLAGINAVAGANINLNQLTGTTTGTILNPNVELAYEAPKLRNFSLKFKLVPRTSNESVDIRAICNRFKKSMLPSFGGQALFGTTEAANLITIPDLCQVSFMNGGKIHPYLPQYKLCGITDVNINYTAAGAYSTVGSDGAPTAVELTISFLETKLVFSNEVKENGGGI